MSNEKKHTDPEAEARHQRLIAGIPLASDPKQRMIDAMYASKARVDAAFAQKPKQGA